MKEIYFNSMLEVYLGNCLSVAIGFFNEEEDVCRVMDIDNYNQLEVFKDKDAFINALSYVGDLAKDYDVYERAIDVDYMDVVVEEIIESDIKCILTEKQKRMFSVLLRSLKDKSLQYSEFVELGEFIIKAQY